MQIVIRRGGREREVIIDHAPDAVVADLLTAIGEPGAAGIDVDGRYVDASEGLDRVPRRPDLRGQPGRDGLDDHPVLTGHHVDAVPTTRTAPRGSTPTVRERVTASPAPSREPPA